VTDAFIDETANILEDLPTYGDTMVNPPSLKMPRLRCFVWFNDGDPAQPDYVRVMGWGSLILQEGWFNLDKAFSRMGSMMAIPKLLHEINVLGKPRRDRSGDPGRTIPWMVETSGVQL